jgi:hypothetical protein
MILNKSVWPACILLFTAVFIFPSNALWTEFLFSLVNPDQYRKKIFTGVTFAWLIMRKEIKFESSHVLMNFTWHVLTNGSRIYMGNLSLPCLLFWMIWADYELSSNFFLFLCLFSVFALSAEMMFARVRLKVRPQTQRARHLDAYIYIKTCK